MAKLAADRGLCAFLGARAFWARQEDAPRSGWASLADLVEHCEECAPFDGALVRLPAVGLSLETRRQPELGLSGRREDRTEAARAPSSFAKRP